MSTGCECVYIEVEPGSWYYVLESDSSWATGASWLDNAKAYGPFGSEDEVRKHLHDHHPNPGGAVVIPHSPGEQLSDEWKRLIEQAPDNMQAARPQFGTW